MAKIITIIGTRPEIIRLSRIIPLLDATNENILVHTGQNYDFELDKIFFKELKVRKPNYYLGAKGSFANQLSVITKKLEKIILKEKPTKFIVLGDTNSSLGAVIAKRLKVRVYHLEAGNRSYLKHSPEEVNRRIIDHTSDINMPYTKRSCENLVSEGIKRKDIFIIGNPIFEVINYYKDEILKSQILNKLKLTLNNYALCTLHREENVDKKERLQEYLNLLDQFTRASNTPVVFSVHPRTRKNIKKFKILIPKKVILINPLGFLDFLNLEINSKFLVTDSGTVQEEASIIGKLCFIFRESTERPETIENGDSIIINKKIDNLKYLKNLINLGHNSNPIPDYNVSNVSQIVTNIVNSDFKL